MSRSRNHRPQKGCVIYKSPRRGEIWLVVDHDEKHNGKESEREYENSVQGGTRTCIVVSNDSGNIHSPNVEVVYTTTKKKNELPTHFLAQSTPEPSTVQCEAIMAVPKKDLTKYYGTLTLHEKCQLDRCLKISIGL